MYFCYQSAESEWKKEKEKMIVITFSKVKVNKKSSPNDGIDE